MFSNENLEQEYWQLETLSQNSLNFQVVEYGELVGSLIIMALEL
ncbi:hypothetical protein [Oculatella sp. FACHB-28]|nr:hypothetical protein [Oculatella sp. FACHB-28]